MGFKIDLHTHSTASYDGGIPAAGYAEIFRKKILDFAAVTDHNDIGFAREMSQEFGDKIITGEEITSQAGEIIGLFLEKVIPKNLTALETVRLIKEQGGIVYIPHPFERLRKGIDEKSLREIVEFVDIVEVFNGRARFRGEAGRAREISRAYKRAGASASDAHCVMGIGTSYSIINVKPDARRLTKALTDGDLIMEYSPLVSYICPFINKIKTRIRNYVK